MDWRSIVIEYCGPSRPMPWSSLQGNKAQQRSSSHVGQISDRSFPSRRAEGGVIQAPAGGGRGAGLVAVAQRRSGARARDLPRPPRTPAEQFPRLRPSTLRHWRVRGQAGARLRSHGSESRIVASPMALLVSVDDGTTDYVSALLLGELKPAPRRVWTATPHCPRDISCKSVPELHRPRASHRLESS